MRARASIFFCGLLGSASLWAACDDATNAAVVGAPGVDAAPGTDTGISDPSNDASAVDAGPTDSGKLATKSGIITLVSRGNSDNVFVTAAGASFSNSPATSGTSANCTESMDGPCTITLCSAPDADAGTTDAGTPQPQAGIIKIAGGKLPASFQILPKADGSYTPATNTNANAMAPWSGGDTLLASAAGGDVPAFDLSFKAPSFVTVTAPTFNGTSALVVPHNTAFTWTWTGGTSGKMNILVSGYSATQKTLRALCLFDAAAGTGAIPQTVISQFSGATSAASLVEEVAKTVSGDFGVTLTAGSLVKSGAGSFTVN